jgi:hypothetical protein
MNWRRVTLARQSARALLATPVIVGVFLFVVVPSFAEPTIGGRVEPRTLVGIPIGTVALAVGVVGLFIGYVWMWRIYRAPTKYEGAHWRFRDH